MSFRPSAASPSPSRLRAWLRRELLPLAVMLLLLGAARSSFANHYVVPTGSMEYTLMPGDRVVVDMSAYGVRLPFTSLQVWPRGVPHAGDVAVFDSPVDGERLIKRVVAVAGHRVEVDSGHLMLDGVPMARIGAEDVEAFGQRFAHLNLDAGGGPDVHGLVVPPGKVLVMGDHRGDSLDGRYFGLVDAGALYGKAVGIYWRRGTGPVWRRL